MKAHTAQYLRDLAARPPERNVVAFFDLDRTLIDGYSLTALAWQELFNGDMGPARFVSLGVMFARYGLKQIQYDDMLRATINDIAGMSEVDLTALGQQAYDRRLAKWMYGESEALVKAHKALGDDVVMVTSATSYQAAPVARRLGIEHLCCTELEVVDGRIDGGVTPCYGPGKLEAARAYIEGSDLSLETAYFYSDSPEDLPLLEAVGRPVVVNGKRALVQLGEARGWPLLEFEDTGALQRSAKE